jgi:hypothetical protein
MKSYLDWLYEDEEKLNEASLGRFIQHMENNEPFAIISAYRYGEKKSVNDSATNRMRSEIMSAGFGFHKAMGGYVYNGTDIDSEKSSIVYGTKETEKKLRTLVFELGAKYKQQSVLWCGSDGNAIWRYTSTFWDQDVKPPIQRHIGDVKPLGKFVPTKIGEYYSRIGKKQFTFRSIED